MIITLLGSEAANKITLLRWSCSELLFLSMKRYRSALVGTVNGSGMEMEWETRALYLRAARVQ